MTSQRIRILEAEIDGLGPEVRDVYDEMVANGTAPAMAHMFLMRQGPQMKNSDRTFNQETRRKMMEMDDYNRTKIIEQAERAGISTQGKYYMGGLGRYTDPRAWVSEASDVLEQCKKRNLNSQGMLTHKATPIDPPKKVGGDLAPDIMNEMIIRECAADPATAEKLKKTPKHLHALREKIRAKHAPSAVTL